MLRAFSWVVVANLARQVAFLAVNALLFSRLSRPYFGALALAFGYMTVFVGLGDFGIRQIAWRDIARRPARAADQVGRFLTARTLTGLASVGLYVLLMPMIWDPEAPRAIYLAYAVAIVVNQGTFEFALFGLDRIDLYARFSLIAFSTYFLLCLVAVTGDDRAWLVPVFLSASMGLMLFLELRWARDALGALQFRLRAVDLAGILSQSWPIGIAETINRAALSYPVILIGLLVGVEGVGNYRIAEIGYSFVAQFGYMFASAGFSQLARVFERDRSRASSMASRMAGSIFVASLLAGGCLAMVGPLVLPLLFDAMPQQTLAVVRLLGVALVFAAPARFFRGLLASIDRQRALATVNATALLTGLAVGWVATSAYGIVGMAASVIVIEALSLILLLAAFWQGVRSSPPASPPTARD